MLQKSRLSIVALFVAMSALLAALPRGGGAAPSLLPKHESLAASGHDTLHVTPTESRRAPVSSAEEARELDDCLDAPTDFTSVAFTKSFPFSMVVSRDALGRHNHLDLEWMPHSLLSLPPPRA